MVEQNFFTPKMSPEIQILVKMLARNAGFEERVHADRLEGRELSRGMYAKFHILSLMFVNRLPLSYQFVRDSVRHRFESAGLAYGDMFMERVMMDLLKGRVINAIETDGEILTNASSIDFRPSVGELIRELVRFEDRISTTAAISTQVTDIIRISVACQRGIPPAVGEVYFQGKILYKEVMDGGEDQHNLQQLPANFIQETPNRQFELKPWIASLVKELYTVAQ